MNGFQIPATHKTELPIYYALMPKPHKLQTVVRTAQAPKLQCMLVRQGTGRYKNEIVPSPMKPQAMLHRIPAAVVYCMPCLTTFSFQNKVSSTNIALTL